MGFLGKLGASIASFGTDLIQSKYEQDQSQKAAREAAEKNRDISIEMFNLQKQTNLEQWEREKAYNLELWNRQNAYNTPAAQMQRLKEAGLNPRLMFDQGTTGLSSPPPVASLDTPHVETPRMETSPYRSGRPGALQGISDWMEVKQAGLQNQNLAAQNALIHAQAELTSENAAAIRRENRLFNQSGGSKYDPTFLKPLLRFGNKYSKFYGDVGDRAADKLGGPMFEVWNQFLGRMSEYFQNHAFDKKGGGAK